METLKRIYLAEDSVDLRTLAVKALSRQGFDVKAFEDGQKCLTQLERDLAEHNDLPDMLVTDINMPNMDGHQLIERLRKVNDFDDLPIMVHSSEPEVRDHVYDEETRTYSLRKPSMPKDLASYVGEILGLHKKSA